MRTLVPGSCPQSYAEVDVDPALTQLHCPSCFALVALLRPTLRLPETRTLRLLANHQPPYRSAQVH